MARRAMIDLNLEIAGSRGIVGIFLGTLALIASWVWTPLRATWVFFREMHPRVRAMTMITVAVALLLFVGLVASHMLFDHIRMTSGAFLEEALVPPYGMNLRAMPSPGASLDMLVPPTLGNYARWQEPAEDAAPAGETEDDKSSESESNAAAQDDPIARLVSQTPSPLTQCLVSATDDVQTACQTIYLALAAESGVYLSDSQRVDVTVAEFRDEARATTTVNELFAFARSIGRTGNFVMGGAGPVDYFYSFAPGWVSFTWARGTYVFSVSGTSFADLEAVVAALPY